MRQAHSKRSRPRGRKVPNNLNRSFDSNGPDVKIRGTASHIFEKYQSLARDAHSSGDRVAAENYLQHAEHYYRIMMAVQQTAAGAQPLHSSAGNGAAHGAQNGANHNGANSSGDNSGSNAPSNRGGGRGRRGVGVVQPSSDNVADGPQPDVPDAHAASNGAPRPRRSQPEANASGNESNAAPPAAASSGSDKHQDDGEDGTAAA